MLGYTLPYESCAVMLSHTCMSLAQLCCRPCQGFPTPTPFYFNTPNHGIPIIHAAPLSPGTALLSSMSGFPYTNPLLFQYIQPWNSYNSCSTTVAWHSM